jgi:hypothetical protein
MNPSFRSFSFDCLMQAARFSAFAESSAAISPGDFFVVCACAVTDRPRIRAASNRRIINFPH